MSSRNKLHPMCNALRSSSLLITSDVADASAKSDCSTVLMVQQSDVHMG